MPATAASTRSRSISFTAAYIGRHARRSAAKSLLSIGLALLLAGTIGQLTMIRGIYKDIYEHIGVKVYVFSGLRIAGAVKVDESEYIRKPAQDGSGFEYLKAPYYESAIRILECKSAPVTAYMTNNIERCTGGDTGGPVPGADRPADRQGSVHHAGTRHD